MAVINCKRCKGYGKIWRIEADGGREVICPHCKRTGEVDSSDISESLAIDPFANLKKVPWSSRDIVFGIGIPIFFWIFCSALFHLDQIRYRPWIAMPLHLSLWILLFLLLLSFPFYVCKKRGFWPLFQPVSLSKLCREFLISLLILLPINLIIVLIGALLSVLLKTEVSVPVFQQWTSYAPNTILVIAFLVIGFTLGPVAEEIYYRGFLYNALKGRVSLLIAAISSSIIFSVSHQYNFLGNFLIFLLGIALVVVYEKRQSLLSPIFVHAIRNAIVTIPILFLCFQNFHIIASDWNEAKVQPDWFSPTPLDEIKRQEDGIKQWQYAIDTWGSEGSRQWKTEMNAFNAVCTWFPQDRKACAKAKLGIVAIYRHYLRDYRRAIVEADNLLSQYPDQKEECALALFEKGWSYYMLRDFQKSRKSLNLVIDKFKEYKSASEWSQEGIKWLNALER